MFSSTRLVSEWKNGLRLLKCSKFRCWMLFFRMRGCFITLTRMKSMSLYLPLLAIFLKYSQKGKSASSLEGIQNVPSDVSYEVAHYQVSSRKQGMCKMWKNNFRCRFVKYKSNLYETCFEILHGCLTFDCGTQGLKM